MGVRERGADDQPTVEQVLGYLNFSSGAPDPQFLAGLNGLFGQRAGQAQGWQLVFQQLESELTDLSGRLPAFSDVTQATSVLRQLRQQVLPGYLKFHADLLFHQTADDVFQPFFVGRVCEAVLEQGAPWDETERIVQGALTRLNDYLGHRPVPALATRRHEPYRHEWIRPIPVYIEGAGVASGRFHEVVSAALDILAETDPDILRAAHFEPGLLAELAYDPRAYDFDHPVNKRPNYHFGQWDPNHIDNQGRYRRFVVQQVTLGALLKRLDDVADVPREDLLFEAAAVLAGTILMASGVSGGGPSTHDSSVTLASLLPAIANYRDVFYERLIERAEPRQRDRLLSEAKTRRQPFGGARQHLNATLARQRASQLEHMQLAKIFARMGHFDAAAKQVGVVPVASARMTCQIDCRLTAGDFAVATCDLSRANQLAQEMMELLQRAIECGAIIDPWNILGFDAHFSLFPALENSVHDHRADDLVSMMDRIFAFYSRVWSAAAADDRQDLCAGIKAQFADSSSWWRQFAAHEVSSVEAEDSAIAFDAARHVAEALNLWHKGGAASGDIRFWAPHAHMFDSPKAFSLVVEALLERDDFVASMALLMQWLNQHEHVPLQLSGSSFHQRAQQWLLKVLHEAERSQVAGETTTRTRKLVRKFFDYLEANADQYWSAPAFELGQPVAKNGGATAAEVDTDEEAEDLFSAAYEDMVYRDSTDDGVDGELFETGDVTQDELTRESQRISERLAFLSSLARLWKLTAVSQCLCESPEETSEDKEQCAATIRQWIHQALENRQGLVSLLESVRRYRIPMTGADHDSLIQYDRQRLVKESLLDRIVSTCVDVSVVGQILVASLAAQRPRDDETIDELAAEFGEDAIATIRVITSMLQEDDAQMREHWDEMQQLLAGKTLLYVPLSKGGDPRQIVAARCRQHLLQDLLAWLPRRGFWVETCQLIETARAMERSNPIGPGAVTEFDELFKIGYKALVESLVTSNVTWDFDATGEETQESVLVQSLEEMTEVLLASWLNHSRTLRLSVLERVTEEEDWNKLVRFIQRYGDELFTQYFFSLGNVRAILHQGVSSWLERLAEEADDGPCLRLLNELGDQISHDEAEEHLSLVLEAVVENYGEYRDYNSTTTQSDRGEMLYMLLDFLRLRTEYDRICWHLKPVVLAHEILLRRNQDKAARLWRRALTERIGSESEQYLQRLAALQEKYAIRMPTVADRLAERFVRPMAIDRIRALVKPAMEEARQEGSKPVFELLEHETEVLTREPTGVGFDIPPWLLALEDEVDRIRQPTHRHNFEKHVATAIQAVALTREQVCDQLDQCASI